MKIICDACGAYFKTEDNVVCPYCGMAYESDSELKTETSHDAELRRLELEKAKLQVEKEQVIIDRENQRYDFNQQQYAEKLRKEKRQGRIAKGCLLVVLSPIILFVILGIILVVAASVTESNTNLEKYSYVETWEEDAKDYLEEFVPDPVIKEPAFVTADYRSPAENEQYRIEIAEISWISEDNKYPYGNFVEADHKVLQVRFKVKNNTKEDRNFDEPLYLYADELFCNGAGWMQVKEEPKRIEGGWIPAGATVDGWALWQVPEDVKDIRITIGDYLEFIANDIPLNSTNNKKQP